MKKIRVLTSRANFISCVTMSIVIPSFANCRITLSTSPTMVGSRADVGSSNKITSGFMARQRAMATRCFCPPERLDGYTSALSATPTLRSSVIAASRASSLLFPRILTGENITFSSTVMWSKRLKLWNTIPIFWRSLWTG